MNSFYLLFKKRLPENCNGWRTSLFPRSISHRTAFTLVEVLIVLSIIGVLTAILLPVFNSARDRTRNGVCQNNLRQIYVALQLYANDQAGFYPAVNAPSSDCSWVDGVAPYAKGNQIFTCPLAPDQFYRAGCEPTKSEDGVVYHFDGGYLFNSPDSSQLNRIAQTRIRKPSQMILLLEGNQICGFTQAGPGNGPLSAERLKDMGVALRHQKGMNAGFADGHTKWLPAETIAQRKLWTLSGQN